MKKLLVTAIAAFASLAVTGVDAMTLAEAGARKSEAAADPKAMSAVMKDLSAEDQVSFLSMVVGEIEASPLSAEEKTAAYLAAAAEAVANCTSTNRVAMLAETFAAVPLASLTAVNEKFASYFKEGSTPEDLKAAAEATMRAVESRTATAADAERRNTFAVLMFLRAADGATASELRESLLADYTSEASLSWVPAALGEVNGTTDYRPLLGDTAAAPDLDAVYSLLIPAPAALSGAILADLAGNGSAFADVAFDPAQFNLPDSSSDFGVNMRITRTTDGSKPWNNTFRRGEEPDVYPGQDL